MLELGTLVRQGESWNCGNANEPIRVIYSVSDGGGPMPSMLKQYCIVLMFKQHHRPSLHVAPRASPDTKTLT